MDKCVEYYCISHIGCQRSENQDNFICGKEYNADAKASPIMRSSGRVNCSEPFLLGIFDGMGGGEFGEVASLIAAKTASETTFGPDIRQTVEDMYILANKRICEYRDEHATGSVGATAALLAFTPGFILSSNIGDSRIFRLSGDDFLQVSKNHVLQVGNMAKPTLSQHLGIPEDERILRPFFLRGDWVMGDKYLICSDGLTDMVSYDEISAFLRNGKPQQIAELLLAKALENGGVDNTTIIVAEILG
ncbi:MAG: serine/threonine-protein phosphatase [Clostridiales bacterium]|nr:serine/threonine-protein phosphatase [Clostridiales bacterium]